MLFLIIQSVFAQQNKVNLQNNFGVSGYDVVSYFNSNPNKGSTKYILKHDGVFYRFESETNLDKFKRDPLKYIPQYGGWCAYAMATTGEKVKVNPKTFDIRNGKLYLFYDAYFSNTYEDWIKEGPEKLLVRADENWKKIN